jgi:hypothetical protein
MTQREYLLNLTVDGKLDAWTTGHQTFEEGLRRLADGLVVGASAIAEYRSEEGAEDWATDLGQTWWEDLERVPPQARRQVLSRMLVAGIPTPIRYQYTTDDGE